MKRLRVEPFKMDEHLRDSSAPHGCLQPTGRLANDTVIFVSDGFVFKRICLKSVLFCLSYHLVTSL